MSESPRVTLVERAGCGACERAAADLVAELGPNGFARVDVDLAAEAGDPDWRGEYGDRLPVVLLDGEEHGYGEVDRERLRRDLSTSPG